ncbi:hypothetical protein GCM10022254_02050 [Actinomadura meridiana]|uniref:Uncharacterized protein n=1 Tax=Actinomadura meridiana TaxID=559626 RepID=A0ABP8BRN9_9ACTN
MEALTRYNTLIDSDRPPGETGPMTDPTDLLKTHVTDGSPPGARGLGGAG